MEIHKRLYNTAVKLSVYSSFLDFGLAISVVALQKNFMPFLPVPMLLNFFDTAIAYLTFTIISLFSLSLLLKYKNRIITITPLSSTESGKNTTAARKIQVAVVSNGVKADMPTARVPASFVEKETKKEAFERFVNSKTETFLRINGVWYKASKDAFSAVSRPDYN